jgi:hypothetical protein
MTVQTPTGGYYQTGKTVIIPNGISPRNYLGYRPVGNDQHLFTDPSLLTMMRQDVQRILSKSQLKNRENVQTCIIHK